jgi:hypothetical protein
MYRRLACLFLILLFAAPGRAQQKPTAAHSKAGAATAPKTTTTASLPSRRGSRAAGGLSGSMLVAAVVPGVGLVTAAGLLGVAVLTAAGATLGAATGGSLENLTTEGLPEDEIFVYEDALRKGRTVVIALAEDEAAAAPLRELLKSERAETTDAARQQWWTDSRSAEHEHYSTSGRNFRDDEKFYRLGFEAALHARTRCKEFDQVSAEMASKLEELQRRYPGVEVAEAFTRGYQRGREYYQHLCDVSRAA